MRFTLLLCLFLSSCGYHLVGQGGNSDVIAAGSEVYLLSTGENDTSWLLAIRETLNQRYHIVDEPQQASTQVYRIRILHPSEQLIPVAYDASGIAVQYQLRLAAAVLIQQQGKDIWSSGVITVSGDVFAAGDPADILSQQNKLVTDLRESWAASVRTRMRSGF